VTSDDRPLVDELVLALVAADAADAVTLPGFRGAAFAVEHKADRSEVTAVDRAAEAAVRAVLADARPSHGIFGEEHGLTGDESSPWRWVIDPIDGTSNFIRGVPVWASLIALVHDDVPVLGVVSAPALGTRWWATSGGGARCNGEPIRVSEVRDVGEAHVSVTPNDGWARAGRLDALTNLQRSAARARGFGDFWQHMLVAQGALDVAVDAIGLGSYDTAAIYPIVAEAGGRATDRHGRTAWQSDSLVTTNGLLHDAVISALA
jgi:histidinol-phosphatase